MYRTPKLPQKFLLLSTAIVNVILICAFHELLMFTYFSMTPFSPRAVTPFMSIY